MGMQIPVSVCQHFAVVAVRDVVDAAAAAAVVVVASFQDATN